LFLQGVYKNDCDKIEDFFHKRLLNTNDSKNYDKIPLVFYNLDSWIKKTNLLCWNCHRVPKSVPWFEPQSIDVTSKGSIGNLVTSDKLVRNHNTVEYCINVKGIFCSCNCVMRYILINSKNLPDKINKISMLHILHEIFTGKKVIEIEPAPLVTDLVQYGGNLTEIEYQKKIDDFNNLKNNNDNFINNCKAYFREYHTSQLNLL
jgi:hypothetical protein